MKHKTLFSIQDYINFAASRGNPVDYISEEILQLERVENNKETRHGGLNRHRDQRGIDRQSTRGTQGGLDRARFSGQHRS